MQDLKEQISKMIDIPSNFFKLNFKEEILDEFKKLMNYDISLSLNNLNVKFLLRPISTDQPGKIIQLFVRDLNGRTMTYKLSIDSLVLDLMNIKIM